MKAFKEKVDVPDKNGCCEWPGRKRQEGERLFGIFDRRRQGQGYVMQQRFVFIMAQPVATRDTDIKVEPRPTCKLGELCCTLSHIRPKG